MTWAPYEGGPNATTITFTAGAGVTLEGGVEQLSTPERHYDKTFEMEIGTFAGKAPRPERGEARGRKGRRHGPTGVSDLRRHELHAARGYGNDDRPDGTGRRSDAYRPPRRRIRPQPGLRTRPPLRKPRTMPAEARPQAAAEPAQKDAAGGGSLWALIIEAILWVSQPC